MSIKKDVKKIFKNIASAKESDIAGISKEIVNVCLFLIKDRSPYAKDHLETYLELKEVLDTEFNGLVTNHVQSSKEILYKAISSTCLYYNLRFIHSANADSDYFIDFFTILNKRLELSNDEDPIKSFYQKFKLHYIENEKHRLVEVPQEGFEIKLIMEFKKNLIRYYHIQNKCIADVERLLK